MFVVCYFFTFSAFDVSDEFFSDDVRKFETHTIQFVRSTGRQIEILLNVLILIEKENYSVLASTQQTIKMCLRAIIYIRK